MRYGLVLSSAITASLTAATASAVTITNLDQTIVHIYVCDDKCGPSHGDDWGSARDFWLAAGESQSFDCSGKCFVGTYSDDNPPTVGEMAFADDDQRFQGDETGYFRDLYATHKAN